MAPRGPQLPPSIAEKRKRNDNDSDGDTDSSSSSGCASGPAPLPRISEPEPKKSRIIGPSLPSTQPTSLIEAESDSESESSDDDGFGPSLPQPDGDVPNRAATDTKPSPQASTTSANIAKRDDWMMVPPSGGDWTARVDPTKLKNRKFNTGKGAKGPSTSGAATDSWHETPQEKQARLQREMMGIKDPSEKPSANAPGSDEKISAETAKRMEEFKKTRGPTLYEAHQTTKHVEQEDDPSARAFDREKDIGGGLQINATQRRDMMKKASDFNSRFSSARYL